MKKLFVFVICWFILDKKKRDSFRKRNLSSLKIEAVKNNIQNIDNLNKIKALQKNNFIDVSPEDLSKIDLNIEGKNNKVIIGKLSNGCPGKLYIKIGGDNNSIVIDKRMWITAQLHIEAGRNHSLYGLAHDISISIGENTSFGHCYIQTVNSNCSIKIGKNCMIARDVCILNTDFHPIYDLTTKKIINKVKSLIIGDHCWIGQSATILKNTIIPNDCIVGAGSVVSSRIESISSGVHDSKSEYSRWGGVEPHSIIAGNPAKVVRKNCTWSSDGSHGYVQNERE